VSSEQKPPPPGVYEAAQVAGVENYVPPFTWAAHANADSSEALAALRAALVAKLEATITVPAPTPDEDGWFRANGWKVRHLNSVVEMEDPYGCAPLFMPDEAEFLGAALVAAAQDARDQARAANG
jgi:hypothetical protein